MRKKSRDRTKVTSKFRTGWVVASRWESLREEQVWCGKITGSVIFRKHEDTVKIGARSGGGEPGGGGARL